MNNILNLHSQELNSVIEEYGSVSFFLNKNKINQVMESVLQFNQNVYYFTDEISSSHFNRLKNNNIKYHFMIEFMMLADTFTKNDLIVIDLVSSYSLNFFNPLNEQVAKKIRYNYFRDFSGDTFLQRNDHSPLVIFLLEDEERNLMLFKEDQKINNPLKYMAKFFIPIKAYLYKNNPFNNDLLEFLLEKPQDDKSKLWYPCTSNSKFTQNELRKKAFEFLPGKVDPDMVISNFCNNYEEFWPFIFSLDEIKKCLDRKEINKKLWYALWNKANCDDSFDPEVYNNWWFVYKYLDEKNPDQQRKILDFEFYTSLKMMGFKKIRDLAEILKQISEKRRYNIMRYWSRSKRHQLEPEDINGFIKDIPMIYNELTLEMKKNLDFSKITSWESLHDYISDQQTLVDYGINQIPSQSVLKFLENKDGIFRCIIPSSPPEIKKLGKVFHNCLFSYTAKVQAGDVMIATFFDDEKNNLCVAFHYEYREGLLLFHLNEALAKDNIPADPSFVLKVKAYLINKIEENTNRKNQ